MDDLDQLTKNEIEYNLRSLNYTGGQQLSIISNELKLSCRTDKGSPLTNTIDVRNKLTFNINEERRVRLHNSLNLCQIEGTYTYWSEPQDPEFSGIMLDFDYLIATNQVPVMTDTFYQKFTTALINIFNLDFEWDVPHTTQIFFTIKTVTKPTPSGDGYKHGFHILVPGLMVSRAYKKWLINEHIMKNVIIASALKDIGVITKPEDAIDVNSAHVPVYFFGSCKCDSIPYALGAIYSATIDAFPVFNRLTETDIKSLNLVREMALHDEGSLVKMIKPTLNERVELIAHDNTVIVNTTENALQQLNFRDVNSRVICKLLDILPPKYYSDYDLWRNIIFALASSKQEYWPIAQWFSQKNGQKWLTKNSKRLESIWNSAMVANERETAKITIGSIYYWAKQTDPEQYQIIIDNSCKNILRSCVITSGGKLLHYPTSIVLHKLISSKYCTDKNAKGKHEWYEFITPGDKMQPGEVWKWRREGSSPDSLQVYISEQLSDLAKNLLIELEDRHEECRATDEKLFKYYTLVIKNYRLSLASLQTDTYKTSLLKQSCTIFRRYGFIENLNKNPRLFGVANGVLELNADNKWILIDHHHEHAITEYAKVFYRRFDPHHPNEMDQLVLNSIEDIIIEDDAREWIMFLLSQGVDSRDKEGIFIIWEGIGQNGKTTLLRAAHKALGPKGDKFNSEMLCSKREESDKPNSGLMKLSTINSAYSEELNPNQAANTGRIKEIANPGEISTRELNGTQQTITMHANFWLASQHSPVFNSSEHALWRRIFNYTSKRQYRKNPDPNNPYEKKDDQRYVKELPNNPEFISAWLGILVYFNERLHAEHDGKMKNINCKTIEREREIFRNNQDTLNRWICESIVVSPKNEERHTLAAAAQAYKTWYAANIDSKSMMKSNIDICKEFKTSVLDKYMKTGLNGSQVLCGCRFISANEEAILDEEAGEHFIGYKNDRTPLPRAVPPGELGLRKWWLPPVKDAVLVDNE